ncbi:MAG: Omp28-related outer membrane protein [Bacteroidota bacterium]
MKNKIIFAALVLFMMASCKKSSDENPQPETPADTTSNSNNNNNNNNNNNPAVPTSFTQKVLLEQFTGAWCSTYPDADYKRDQVLTANSGKVIAVAVHETDGMELPLIWTLDGIFHTNIPSGMINRTVSTGNVILNQTQWMSNTTVALGKTAQCGLKVKSSVSGTTASIEVHVGFKSVLTGTNNLTVYLIQNKVTGTGSGYNQANAYNTSSGSPFYNLGNPIVNYQHNYVVKKVLTADMGDVIDATKMTVGGEYIKTFSVSISGYNQSELYVVAFVNKVGTTSTTHQIMNVQQAKIGTLKDWD